MKQASRMFHVKPRSSVRYGCGVAGRGCAARSRPADGDLDVVEEFLEWLRERKADDRSQRQ